MFNNHSRRLRKRGILFIVPCTGHYIAFLDVPQQIFTNWVFSILEVQNQSVSKGLP